jgi:hypothetical protein
VVYDGTRVVGSATIDRAGLDGASLGLPDRTA